MTSGGFLDTARIVSSLGVVQGMHVADLGCGSGYFTIALAQAVGPTGVVSAVDVQVEPLEAVKSRAEALGYTTVHTIRADLEVAGATTLPADSHDLALVANVLFQSRQQGMIIREAARITKSGGRVVLIDWKRGTAGLGPPDSLRIDPTALQHTAESEGLVWERALDTGRYSFGMVFKK